MLKKLKNNKGNKGKGKGKVISLLLVSVSTLSMSFLTTKVSVSYAAEQTVNWELSTNSSPWVDKGTLTTTPWDNDTSNYILVDQTQRFQQIEGFGGCFNERGWDAMSVLSQTERDKVIKALFDPILGLKLNITRMPIAASDYGMDAYSYDETPGDYTMANFSIARDQQRMIPFIKAAMAYKPDLKVWGVPWSPPSWMKTNNSLIGGTMKTDPQTMAAYALYFEKYVQAYQAQGINVYMVMPQNEPLYATTYISCAWPDNAIRDFIGQYLGPKFKNDGINSQIWAGTYPTPDNSFMDPILADAAAKSYIQGAGFQWSGDPLAKAMYLTQPQLKLMQTETECGWHENDWNYAESQFDVIKKYFDSGVNSYMLWNMVLDQTGYSTVNLAQGSPIVVDKNTLAVTYNPQYYVFKHFSYYVKPDAYRVYSEGSFNDKIAFVNPDGENVLVVKNNSNSDSTVAINFNGHKIKPTLPAHSVSTFRTSGSMNRTTVNDSATGTGSNQVQYNGSWVYDPKNNFAFRTDDHYSATTNNTYQISFTGTQAVLYGMKSPLNGIGAISVDGGPETMVDFYASTYQGSLPIYTTPTLSSGSHTVTVRVTGTKNAGSANYNVNLDRFDVVNGASSSRLDKTGWVAYASNTEQGGSANNALDGNINSRWSTGIFQVSNPYQWFSVNMGAVRSFNKIVMDAGASTGDYPRQFAIKGSNDGATWVPITTGSGSGAVTTITFPTQQYKYFAIEQSGTTNTNWWSIAELNVYNEDVTANTAVKYEAENATRLGRARIYQDSAASGGYATADLDQAGDGLQFNNVAAGSKLTVQYCSQLSGTYGVYINGTRAASLSFASNGAWSGAYVSASVNVAIPANATVKLQKDSGDAALNIDFITVQ